MDKEIITDHYKYILDRISTLHYDLVRGVLGYDEYVRKSLVFLKYLVEKETGTKVSNSQGAKE